MNRLLAGSLAAMLVDDLAIAQPTAATPTTQAINELIAEKWKEVGIKTPSRKATDLEFMRRVFIDLIGRIPSSEEVRDFEAEQSSDKRAKLVKRLLYSTEYKPKINGSFVRLPSEDKKPRYLTYNYAEEYAEHWANLWTVWLMTRTGHPIYRDRINYWLSQQFEQNRPYREMVIDLLTASGESNENPAVNFIVHHLGEAVPNEKKNELGKHDAVPITSRVTRLFLGLQTQCAQCHDHPFNKEWVQSDFWGVNAFFRQTTRSANPTPGMNNNGQRAMGNPVNVKLSDESTVNKDGVVFFERRDGKLMAAKPNFLKDVAQAEAGEAQNKTVAALPGTKKATRREALAEYVVRHDNFAPAYVNRIWGHLFGRGLNKEPSVDDFGSNNEVVQTELLKKLADDFIQYKYDPKQLLEWICNSVPYNLSHVAVPEYADAKYDPYFARMSLKSMSPEVLYESILTAAKAERLPQDENRKRGRDQFMAKLVRNFGDDEGNELTFNGTVIQALLLLNGRELNDEVSKKGNNAVEAIYVKYNRRSSSIIDEIYLTTLNRRPTEAERATIGAFQKGTKVARVEVAAPTKPGEKGPPPNAKPKTVKQAVEGAVRDEVAFYQDLFWALLNTNEFILSH